MALTVTGQRLSNVAKLDEPTVRVHQTATLTPRPGRGGDWTSPYVIASLEAEPQWNTLGAGLGAPAGPGTDDSVLWPLESAPERAGINLTSDYFSDLATPARISMAVGSAPAEIFEGVPQITARRAFVIHNKTSDGTVYLHYHLANETGIATEDYALLPTFLTEPAEGLALAIASEANDTTVLLAFYQTLAGDVYCKPVVVAPESRNNMAWPKEGNAGVRYPIERPCLDVGASTFIASGGLAGERSGWDAWDFEGGDIFFSPIQAVGLGGGRTLLLTLGSDGVVRARIVSYSNGTITASAPVDIPTVIGGSVALNLYQATNAVLGVDGGSATTVVFTYRSATFRSDVVILDCAGTPTVTASAVIGADYTHATWCGGRVVVLTKSCYAATGLHPLGFGGSATTLHIYDDELVHLNGVQADVGLTNQIQQTGTVTGFANGRLFMFCSSFEAVEYQIGHVFEYEGSGIRLWRLDGDNLVLQDQIGYNLGILPSSTQAVAWNDAAVTLLGPTGETYGAPPGDEAPMYLNFFVGGVLKEANSDVQPYRISDNWLVITEPEKNGVWWTVPDVYTAFTQHLEGTYCRAIHIDNAGVPDLAGEPIWMYANWSWYSALCRISDTRFMHIGTGHNDPELVLGGSVTGKSQIFQVFDVDEATGNLTKIYEEENTHATTQPFTNPFSSTEPGDVSVFWDLLQVGDTNRYLLLYSRIEADGSGQDLWVRTFDLHDDFSATVLDDQIVNEVANGGVFTERKPYDLNRLSDSTYVVTWITDDLDGGHFSSHRGIVLDDAGNMTMGTRLGADPASSTNPPYGFQGVWMHDGCGVGGRYVYPAADIWDSLERYPPIEVIVGEDFVVSVLQRVPYALCVMDIDPVTADLTASWYPCKVDRDAIDEEWYDANQFFATEPQRVLVASDQRVHQAHPDGGLYYFWETSSVHPGPRDNQVWLFQGPAPVPWMINGVADAMTMALYELDDENQVAWFRQPDSWGCFGVPYFVSYQNGSVPMNRKYIACLTTLDYYSRASPTGYEAGFGANLLRVWATGAARGSATPGQQAVRVSTEGRAL